MAKNTLMARNGAQNVAFFLKLKTSNAHAVKTT